MTNRRTTAFLLILAFAPLSLLCAEVTVLLAVGGSVENDFLESIILESASLSLEHRNITVVTLEEGAEAPISGSQIVPEAIGALSTEQNVDFSLISRFELASDTIRFDFAWYDVERGEITSRETSSGKIGLTLDRVIDRTVEKILDSVDERISEVRAVASTQETRPDTGTTGGGGTTSVPAFVEELPPDAARPRKIIDTAAGFATFIAVGDSSEYITLGYNPTFDFSFRINLRRGGFVGIGLSTGINIFQAEGLSLTTRSLIVPIGIDFRYVFESDFFLGLFARLSAGPALFILQPPSDLLSVLSWELLMKVIPYASAGLGLRIKLTHFMGFALDMGYSLYLEDFDSFFLIMGFTPAVTLYFSM